MSRIFYGKADTVVPTVARPDSVHLHLCLDEEHGVFFGKVYIVDLYMLAAVVAPDDDAPLILCLCRNQLNSMVSVSLAHVNRFLAQNTSYVDNPLMVSCEGPEGVVAPGTGIEPVPFWFKAKLPTASGASG